MKKAFDIIVDVGAASGEFTKHVLRLNQNNFVYAIEPNLDENEIHLAKILKEFPNRMSLYPHALGDQSGEFPFYGASLLRGQIGSLNKFNYEKIWSEQLRQIVQPKDLNSYKMVSVRKVQDFLEDNKINKIKFLKIDTQGSDIDILRSFLDNSIVECMVLEINTSRVSSENIYSVDNSFDKLINLISKYSLRIIKLVPNSDLTEYNVFLANEVNIGGIIIDSLKIDQSLVFGKYWTVLGMGKVSKGKANNNVLIKKIFTGLKHPQSSIKSVIHKLTS
jgi:FkbM family methyltransferase